MRSIGAGRAWDKHLPPPLPPAEEGCAPSPLHDLGLCGLCCIQVPASRQPLHGGSVSSADTAGEERSGVRSSEGEARLGCRVLAEEALRGVGICVCFPPARRLPARTGRVAFVNVTWDHHPELLRQHTPSAPSWLQPHQLFPTSGPLHQLFLRPGQLFPYNCHLGAFKFIA